jgi:hypothetical protein
MAVYIEVSLFELHNASAPILGHNLRGPQPEYTPGLPMPWALAGVSMSPAVKRALAAITTGADPARSLNRESQRGHHSQQRALCLTSPTVPRGWNHVRPPQCAPSAGRGGLSAERGRCRQRRDGVGGGASMEGGEGNRELCSGERSGRTWV